MRRTPALFVLAALATACTARAPAPPSAPAPASPSPHVSTASPSPSQAPSPPATFSAKGAMAWVRALATGIGPREATSAAYRRAASLVASALTGAGYAVRRASLSLPGGRSSNGYRLYAGRTENVIGEPPGFDPAAPHLVVGAHLDTVPRVPGANDNASGVAILLELAKLAAAAPPRTPLVFVAFGGEERRGPGRNERLYGSRAYVRSLDSARRDAVRGMVSIDMVGAGREVLVGRTSGAPDDLVRRFLDRAAALGITALPHVTRRPLSDHASFEEAGILAAWLWAGDHPTLHKPSDVAGVVQEAELARVGTLAWETLRIL